MGRNRVKTTTEKGTVVISGDAEQVIGALNEVAKNIGDGKRIEIRSATLDGDFLQYGYDIIIDANTKDSVPKRKGGRIVHDDLKAKFKKLVAHLPAICEEIPEGDIVDIDDIEPFNADLHDEGSLPFKVSRFRVQSYSLKSSGENETVTINGQKQLSNGEWIGMDSYPVRWDSEYGFINELKVAIEELNHEVELYMGGKTAPRMIQPEIPGLDENTEADEQE
jgi:hypothetical protein